MFPERFFIVCIWIRFQKKTLVFVKRKVLQDEIRRSQRAMNLYFPGCIELC